VDTSSRIIKVASSLLVALAFQTTATAMQMDRDSAIRYNESAMRNSSRGGGSQVLMAVPPESLPSSPGSITVVPYGGFESTNRRAPDGVVPKNQRDVTRKPIVPSKVKPPEDEDCRSAKQALHNAIRAKHIKHLTHAQVEAMSCAGAQNAADAHTSWESAWEKENRERAEQSKREFEQRQRDYARRVREANAQHAEAEGLVPPPLGPSDQDRKDLGYDTFGPANFGNGVGVEGRYGDYTREVEIQQIIHKAESQQTAPSANAASTRPSISDMKARMKKSFQEFRDEHLGPKTDTSPSRTHPAEPLRDAARDSSQWNDVNDALDFAETGKRPSKTRRPNDVTGGSNAERAPKR
jgi:hypothetical protein